MCPKKNMTVLSIILSVLLFFAGGMIYLLYRTTNLIMFEWVEYVDLGNSIRYLRNEMAYYSLPQWIKFSLPDGLWVLSYVIFMGTIWKFKLRESLFYILLLPIISVFSELLQLFDLLRGTFDIVDLIFYLFASVLGILYINLLNYNNYE